MSRTAAAILEFVHPEGVKYNPMAAQQWAELSHTIKNVLTATTDECIMDAALGAILTL